MLWGEYKPSEDMIVDSAAAVELQHVVAPTIECQQIFSALLQIAAADELEALEGPAAQAAEAGIVEELAVELVAELVLAATAGIAVAAEVVEVEKPEQKLAVLDQLNLDHHQALVLLALV